MHELLSLKGGGKSSAEPELDAVLQLSALEHEARTHKKQKALQAISNKLDPDLTVQSVLADGNCLFRALARVYNQQTQAGLTHVAVRQFCVQQIQDNPDLSIRFDTNEHMNRYLQHMRLDGSYGDELCVHAFCALYQCKVSVFLPQWDTQIFGNEFAENLHVRIAYNGEDHYDAIIFRKFRNDIRTPAVSHSQVEHQPDVKSENIPAVSHSQVEHQPDDKADTIKILSINAASWDAHSLALLNSGADILAGQETRVSSVGMLQQNNFLASLEHPWTAVWGKPPPNPTNKFSMPATRAVGKSTYGGVGILAKTPFSLVPIGRDGHAAQILHESTRWCTAAIPLGSTGALSRRFLHSVSFYGIANRRNDDKHTQNERLLTQLFNYATSLGQMPVLLCLDSNTTLQNSLALNQALASKQWTDLGAFFSRDNPEPTFSSSTKWDKFSPGKGVTRPDLIIANSAALGLCPSFTLRRDLTVKGHLGLQVTISANKAMELIRVFKPPKRFLDFPAVTKKAPKTKHAIDASFQKHYERHKDSFESAVNTKDSNGAWTQLAQIGEAVLKDFSQKTGEGGRNRVPKFCTQRVVTAAASAHHPQHVSARAITHLHKVLRLLKELKCKQFIFSEKGLTQQASHDAEILAAKLAKHCSSLKIPCPHSWLLVPCDALIDTIAQKIDAITKESRLSRIRAWKRKLRDSFDLHKHGAKAYEWLNSKGPTNLQAALAPDGSVVTSINGMLDVVADAWQSLFHQKDLVNLDAVRHHLGPLLNSYPCDLPPLSGHVLKKKVMAMKSSRAVALDGWRIPELRFLPIQWYELLATCLHAFEQGTPWPDICCLGVISTIPKGAASSPDTQPYGELIAGDGLSTRPITNLSPLYTLYSSCRYTQMNEWRESWLSPCMAGSRCNHEIFDTSWSLALNIEYQTLTETYLAGISMDRKKFFDFLQYDLGFFLLEALGAPQAIIIAAKNMYSQLRCCYKMRKATTQFFPKKHGFAQGDSISLQIALAYMMTWTKFMKADPRQDLVLHTGSFLDDSHFYACSKDLEQVSNALITAWQRSILFDNLAGLETNSNKSFFFANDSALQAHIHNHLLHLPEAIHLVSCDSFKLVGSIITCLGIPRSDCRDQRVKTTIEKLLKLRYAPLRFNLRVRMAGAIFNSATFGTELVKLTKGLLESLCSAIVRMLWRNNVWCRCWATTATHIIPVHRLHPQAASMYHIVTLAARLLRRRRDLREIFEQCFERGFHLCKNGPIAILNQAVTELNAQWHSAFSFRTHEGIILNLLDENKESFNHMLRSTLRFFVCRTNSAYLARLDMQGGPLLAYETNVHLLQQRANQKQPPLSLIQQATLRNIFSGAIHTQERKHKAHNQCSPICPWCNDDEVETVAHIFWHCKKWSHLRDTILTQYGAYIDNLPVCFTECGLFPQRLIDDGTFSIELANKITLEVQTMMIAILNERSSNQNASTIQPKANPKVSINKLEDIKSDEPAVLTKEELFPHYPWSFESQPFTCKPFFTGTIPKNWRVYKAGSEWTFGIQTFGALHWYWSRLKWPQNAEEGQGITWLELALDFHAATHCVLNMPHEDPNSCTAAQRARFFNYASRRMAAICNAKLAPCEQMTHCPVLTCVSLGRASGFTARPVLLCPNFVHSSLFLTVMKFNCRLGQNFKFVPEMPPYPSPMWSPDRPRHRLTGKQTPPSIPEPSTRRQVKSHKETVAAVVWTHEEQEVLNNISDWRRKHQLQKILLHNRSAASERRHIVRHTREGNDFVCDLCKRKNVNLSKLMADTCGGKDESHGLVHAPRDSVKLTRRQALVREHNSNPHNRHLIQIPEQCDDPVLCTQCGASDPDGWRRFQRFAKKICPVAP